VVAVQPRDVLIPAPAAVKLWRRDISEDQVRQVAANGAVLTRNPRPRVPGGRWMIGVDDAGRILTIVVEPVPGGAWRVRSGWRAERAQIVLYRRRRR
jgi:hypothetical protein